MIGQLIDAKVKDPRIAFNLGQLQASSSKLRDPLEPSGSWHNHLRNQEPPMEPVTRDLG